LLLVDTPGIHGKQPRAMNRYMNRAARGAVEGVDVAVLVIEAGRWLEDDALAYSALAESKIPVVLVHQQGRQVPPTRPSCFPSSPKSRKGASSMPCTRSQR
jgi:GTPase Era involved in 16S rRNA processing